jgi:hypothetical protein
MHGQFDKWSFNLVVESFVLVVISSSVFWKIGYLDFALIEEVVEPNILVLEIKLENGEPSFCIIRRSWKIESTSFYKKTPSPNDPATK